MNRQSDPLYLRFRDARTASWDAIALKSNSLGRLYRSYVQQLIRKYRRLIPVNSRVIEIGCAEGSLLAALKPKYGVGLDLSGEMIRYARNAHPELRTICTDIYDYDSDETFDYIILSDIITDLWDVQLAIERILDFSHRGTRIIINMPNAACRSIMALSGRLGFDSSPFEQSRFSIKDVQHILDLANTSIVQSWTEPLWPDSIFGCRPHYSRSIIRSPILDWLPQTDFIVTKPRVRSERTIPVTTVSVIIPTRNEAGRIAELISRIPQMGSLTEIIFVEGGSSDGTYNVILSAINQSNKGHIRVFRQPGHGKGDAVRFGFSKATGDILIILDADLSVSPEDLPHFYAACVSGMGDLINGVRLVYPMELGAMQFANRLANKGLSRLVSWMTGQGVKDTLCGTKVLWREDYARIDRYRPSFSNSDPFGDYDLLLGAARLNLKIVDIPVRYHSRTYGTTNIMRWKHGWRLLVLLAHWALAMELGDEILPENLSHMES